MRARERVGAEIDSRATQSVSPAQSHRARHTAKGLSVNRKGLEFNLKYVNTHERAKVI